MSQIAEPPVGSVVLDNDGDAWQSLGPDCWVRAGVDTDELWSTVLGYGSLLVLHRPDEGPPVNWSEAPS